MIQIQCSLATSDASLFHHAFRRGVGFACRTDIGLRRFLLQELGLTDEQVECDIKTVFLNNAPVDDFDAARVHDGDVLALGTAMPGLVGITMACSSPLSGFRNDISHAEKIPETMENDGAPGRITLKLFSFVGKMCSMNILTKGVEIPLPQLIELLDQPGEHLTKQVLSLRMDEKPVSVRELSDHLHRLMDCNASGPTSPESIPEPTTVRLVCREESPHDHQHAGGSAS